MINFGHPFGYEFFMNENWRELTSEERERFNINKSILNYMINYKEGKEFFVNADGFSKNIDDLENFFNLCKNTMSNHNVEFVCEEKFEGVSLISGDKMEAYKLMSKMPNGIVQVSYFMRLSGLTPGGYLYGCLTTSVKENHDENEAVLVEAITNWKYYDAKDVE